jgi:nicotinate-nucleotide adenylyltransferase
MGADTLEDLPHWRAPGRVCELAIPVVVRRAGLSEPCYDSLQEVVLPSRLELFRRFQVTMPILELTSTEIRTRVANGQSIRYRTPRAVEKYIQTNALYR